MSEKNQILVWLKNNETNKPKPNKTYVIKINWRKVIAYWQKDADDLYHWLSTEGNSYCNSIVSEFAEIQHSDTAIIGEKKCLLQTFLTRKQKKINSKWLLKCCENSRAMRVAKNGLIRHLQHG